MNLSRPADIEADDRFGKLKVLRRVPKRDRGPRYQCGCVCQRIVVVKGSKLRHGKATSCDLRRDLQSLFTYES